MNKVVIGIILFIILLITAGYSRADSGVRIGIGRSVINSHVSPEKSVLNIETGR